MTVANCSLQVYLYVYSLLPASPDPHPSPHPHTHHVTHLPLCPIGEITTTSLLDRETKSEYILIVRAVDGGVGHNQKTGIATVSTYLPTLLTRALLPAHLQVASSGLCALYPEPG